MLLRIILKNFLSFDDEVQFDMFPNAQKTSLNYHIDRSTKVPILKQAAIFGQNGAGKSNLVKALEFMKEFALNKNFLKNIEIDKFLYRLKPEFQSSCLSIIVEFEHKGHFFVYDVKVGMDGIRQEKLSESFPLKGECKMIYHRNGNGISFSDEIKKQMEPLILKAINALLKKNPLSSLMSLNMEFPIFQNNLTSVATMWFNKMLEVIGMHSFMPTLIDLLRTDAKVMEFVQQAVVNLAVGVNTVQIDGEDFDVWAQQHIQLVNTLPDDFNKMNRLALNSNSTPILSIQMENGVKKVYQLMFEQQGKNGFTGRLEASSQSDGTLRALALLPALYLASVKGVTVVIDEINCCLSPNMVKGLVSYFAKNSKSNGQLIFTTHDVQLLDEEDILRSDEVWFVDKYDGGSVMYSHNDFKVNEDISMMRGYNEGRFGAIRFVDLIQKNE